VSGIRSIYVRARGLFSVKRFFTPIVKINSQSSSHKLSIGSLSLVPQGKDTVSFHSIPFIGSLFYIKLFLELKNNSCRSNFQTYRLFQFDIGGFRETNFFIEYQPEGAATLCCGAAPDAQLDSIEIN
jgi:hypothetical protein